MSWVTDVPLQRGGGGDYSGGAGTPINCYAAVFRVQLGGVAMLGAGYAAVFRVLLCGLGLDWRYAVCGPS